MEIREAYHKLEEENHGSKWSLEEDALAFLTDAAIISRLVMSKEGRWPTEGDEMLELKIGECI